MREVRRFNRRTRRNATYQPTAGMRRRRKMLGRRIVQWRKEHAQTVQTGRSAPVLLINAQQEISALEAQVAQLEADNARLVSDNALMARELEGVREYEEAMEVERAGSEASAADSFHRFSSEEPMDEDADNSEAEHPSPISSGGLAEALEETFRGTCSDLGESSSSGGDLSPTASHA